MLALLPICEQIDWASAIHLECAVIGPRGCVVQQEENTMEKKDPKKAYQKPEVRRIKLSLAELTLGTNCDINNVDVMTGFCTDVSPRCNV